MTNHVNTTAKRIMAVDWESSYKKTNSRIALLREYLRRGAWWAEALKTKQWPFFEIADAVNPKVRADPSVVRRVEAHLTSELQGGLMVRVCMQALHFAALLDTGAKLPKVPDSAALPYEPLLMMLERGGGFRLESGVLIEVDMRSVQQGTLQSNRVDKPVVELTLAALDALDAR